MTSEDDLRAELARAGDEIQRLRAGLASACAAGWDACIASMRYEDGTPVEIVHSVNPYRTGGAA